MIIDSDNYKAAGIETLFFPGGEPHVKVPRKWKSAEAIKLFLKLRTWNDVGLAACLLDVLERRGDTVSEVFIPYFPGARQDKAFDMEAPYTVALVENMLCGSHDISVFDPHSPVLEAMGGVRDVYMPADLRIDVDEEKHGPVIGIIAPDAGAYERAANFRESFYPNAALIECSKVRDKRTGHIGHYEMGKLQDSGGRYIVVDDICDGGGTFNLLAQAFEADPMSLDSELELFVSHGIFSKGTLAVSPRYSRITTTDSWWSGPSVGRLTVLPLLPLLANNTEVTANA